MMSLVWIDSFCVPGIRATWGMRGYSRRISKTSECWLVLLNSEGNLRFGASTAAVRDNHSEVNTRYSLSRPKYLRMFQVVLLPSTDTRKCNSNWMQPIQSLCHADHQTRYAPHPELLWTLYIGCWIYRWIYFFPFFTQNSKQPWWLYEGISSGNWCIIWSCLPKINKTSMRGKFLKDTLRFKKILALKYKVLWSAV